ncbi:ATP synthase I chain [Acidovorax delafieldii 2AN]|uniref:ATP synthase I chain n=1 Tax=Acidovorax delafieldii 2AN TaxID=573060 RepID=C5T5X9_ACIDE|nr:ATP synthase subunit I [Acidovorax delafieldii]EER60107.1 ATP synthase I chain [Acidovorax delafieldii 2AN]
MKTIAPETEIEAEDSDFKPLTAQEAQQWRSRNPPVSVWRIVVGQVLVGALVAMLAWALSGRAQVGWSAAYGALSVVVPAALFARGVLRRKASENPRAAMVGFFGWEIAKIVLTVALLAAAPRLVPGLSWLALLVGMVFTMKTYWVALWARPGVRKTD